MASTDIRQFLFYFKYLWSPADFTNLQLWLQETIGGIAQGHLGAAILQGLDASAGGGMSVNIAAGIAVGGSGQLMVLGNTTNVPISSDPSLARKSLIVLRPKLVNMTSIPQPDNPNNMVPLHQQITFDIVVIDGTPNANPVYPPTQADDTVLIGVSMTAALGTIAFANFDRMPVSLPRKPKHRYRKELATYFAGVGDEHIDMDVSASGGTILMPPAANVAGEDFWVTKIDSSANTCVVSGTEPFSGQNTITLDAQWQYVHLRSVGGSWRVL